MSERYSLKHPAPLTPPKEAFDVRSELSLCFALWEKSAALAGFCFSPGDSSARGFHRFTALRCLLLGRGFIGDTGFLIRGPSFGAFGRWFWSVRAVGGWKCWNLAGETSVEFWSVRAVGG